MGQRGGRMQSHVAESSNLTQELAQDSNFYVPYWYVVYTSANHEKCVAEQFSSRSVEYFLPLYEEVRRWKDRRMRLQLPLFPGYVFVRLALRDRLLVLQVPGVVNLVGTNGTPTPLPQKEIDALRTGLRNGVRAEPHPYLAAGRRVRVKSGPFAGLRGVVLRRKAGYRFVICVELIQRCVAVDIEGTDFEPER